MSAYSYGWEKLHLAMHTLAGNGSQADRLQGAIVSNLIRIKSNEDLPPNIRADFDAFMRQMTSVKAKGDEGTAKATVDSLDESGRQQAIDKIIEFYDAVCRHMERD